MLTVAATRGPLVGSGAVLALPVTARKTGAPLVGAGAEALAALGIDAAAALKAEKATGKAGELTAIPVRRDGVDTVLLAGIGDGSEWALRKAAAALVRRAKASKSLATTLTVGRDPASVRAIAEALGLASYTFSRRSDGKPPVLKRAKLLVEDPAAVRRDLARAAAVTTAVHRARDLANTPSLGKSPQWLAGQARELGEAAGVSVTVRDVPQLAAEGFGGVLAVGQGSSRPPCFVEMTWAPPGARRHIVLVGKGITFDSGGLSLKPPDSMPGMKTDMAGGAAVIATMAALADLDVAVKVTGLVPMAENMPGGASVRPGDVVTHYGGRTDEVLNTDAEGRVVLADALAYAVATLSPDVIVDIATLTGAASLGLGRRHGALYATTTTLRDELLAASAVGGERLWSMPLVDDYRDTLDSDIADLRNIGNPEREYGGGSIVAALFLREFVGSVPWAHLDIAGPGRAEADEDEVTKGATGFGVRSFLRWLESQRDCSGGTAARARDGPRGRRGQAPVATHRRPSKARRAVRRDLPPDRFRAVQPRQLRARTTRRPHAIQIAFAEPPHLDQLANVVAARRLRDAGARSATAGTQVVLRLGRCDLPVVEPGLRRQPGLRRGLRGGSRLSHGRAADDRPAHCVGCGSDRGSAARTTRAVDRVWRHP
jgi:leucyl aminopeptidase